MGDPLFELKNFFAIGNYQAAINSGGSLNPKNLSEADRTLRDVYVYRSYIAQGNPKFVLAEISDKSAPSLQAIKLLATYLTNKDNTEIVLVTLKEWMSDGVASSNPILQVVAATVYYHEENYEEAMRCVYQSSSLEG
jgi:coatomer protein complex subunit epsilon